MRAVAVGEEVGDLVDAAAALHGLARLGMAKQHHQHLTELSGRIEGVLVAARARHTEALSASDPVGLERAVDDFEAMGAHLLAAEAAADAHRAWSLVDNRRAHAARRRAEALAKLVPGAR